MTRNSQRAQWKTGICTHRTDHIDKTQLGRACTTQEEAGESNWKITQAGKHRQEVKPDKTQGLKIKQGTKTKIMTISSAMIHKNK